MSEQERTWKCARCGVPLKNTRVIFHYMGRDFGHEVPACPRCGQVLIVRGLAKGRMAQGDELMEDK